MYCLGNLGLSVSKKTTATGNDFCRGSAGRAAPPRAGSGAPGAVLPGLVESLTGAPPHPAAELALPLAQFN